MTSSLLWPLPHPSPFKMSYSNKTLELVRIVQIFLQKERELLDKMKAMQVREGTSLSCA